MKEGKSLNFFVFFLFLINPLMDKDVDYSSRAKKNYKSIHWQKVK